MSLPLRIALASILLAVTSCASTSKRPDAKLIGRWRAGNQSQTAEYSFAADGTFGGSVKSGATTISKFTGKWAVVDGAINYEYTGDALGSIPAGTKDRDRLLEVTDAYYVIEAKDGSRRRYVRVAP
ncbi:MAG: hypothetical protein ABR526_03495 [Chthoniobacterales bacterium]